jgi:shikimate dehydrogenase
MQKYGLIGYPLRHSFSIGYFNEKFRAEGIDAEYLNFEIPTINDFMEVILENPTLAGLNVTIPYKEQVIPFLDELEKDTAAIGAVNVIKIIRKKGKIKLKGYNSDIIGFMQSIELLLQPQHKKALILGTGGSSKAVYHGLKNLGIASIRVSRTPSLQEGVITYRDITPEIMDEYKIIVNCTPVGMYPKVDFYPEIPYQYLTPEHLLYDLLYNPNVTRFMKKGEAQGAVTKNGLEMLLLQAFAAWEIWNKPE